MTTTTALFTSPRILLAAKESQLALASVKVADAIYLTGMRIIQGKNGPFVSMPSKKNVSTGEYHDLFFPASREVKEQMQALILDAYKAELAKAQPQQGA